MFSGYTVEDTAAWIAAYRAVESKRSDALFIDNLASFLLEKSGLKQNIHQDLSIGSFAMITTRTITLDQFLLKYIAQNEIEVVVNIGAGYDTRPYRLNLPADICWIEVDLPQVINFKNDTLKDHAPDCLLERHSFDMAVEKDRAACFNLIAQTGKKTLILTEALIVFLEKQSVISFAQSIARISNVSCWLLEYCTQSFVDYANPLVTEMMAGHKPPFKFGVPDDQSLGFLSHLGGTVPNTSHCLKKLMRLKRKEDRK